MVVMKTEATPDGCTSVRKYLNDRSLCPRWRLCSGCERSAIRSASLSEQYAYLTKRTTMSGYTGWHSMRGLNTKLKEWGISGGSHFIEFTNGSGNQWNTHMHSVLVGFEDDWKVPLKETTAVREWNDDLTMKLQTEKLENKTRSNKRVLSPLGLGRLYTLDIASEDEMASIARYSAKVEYVTKPVKVPSGKLPEIPLGNNVGPASQVGLLDAGRILSTSNHRLYRYGKRYEMKVDADISVFEGGNTITVWALADTWAVQKAYEEAKRVFDDAYEIERENLSKEARARWFDFRANLGVTGDPM
eukprot:gene24839-10214_t